VDVYAHFLDLMLEKLCTSNIQLPRQQPVEKLYDFHLRSSCFQRPGRFQAKKASSDNNHPLVIFNVLHDFKSVIQGSQGEDALLLRSFDGRDEGFRPGCQEKEIKFFSFPLRGLDLFGAREELGHGLGQVDVNALLSVPFLRKSEHFLQRKTPRQKLDQIRAGVIVVFFLRKDIHSDLLILLAECFGCNRPG